MDKSSRTRMMVGSFEVVEADADRGSEGVFALNRNEARSYASNEATVT